MTESSDVGNERKTSLDCEISTDKLPLLKNGKLLLKYIYYYLIFLLRNYCF